MSTTTASHSWNTTQKGLTAILGSIVVNLLVLYVIGWLLIVQMANRPEPPAEEANEVVVSLEELLPEFITEADQADPAKKSYIETYQNQESEMAPENATFESDRNTLAATDMLSAEPSDMPLPTQDGADIPALELQDHKFMDAPDGEISKSPNSAAGAPSTPASEMKPPSPDTSDPQTLVEAPPEKSAEEPTDNPDPKAEETLEAPAEGTMAEGAPTELEEAEEAGGAPDPIEMAKVDLPKMEDTFSDKFEVMDETMEATPDKEDAMPEKNVEELKKRLVPFAKAPEARQNPTEMPTPFLKPQETTPPVNPGSMPSRETNGQADEVAFSPERHRNKMSGSLSNLGRNPAVDAERTPLGQYKKLVSRAIEREWHLLKDQNATFVSFGSLKLSFEVDRWGNVGNLRLIHDDANSIVTGFSQKAVLTADIPPMPPEIIDLLGSEKLEVTYDIIIY